MVERLTTPPHRTELDDTVPLVFLAGPVQGAPDWQTPLARRLLSANPEIAVASPRRKSQDQPELFTPQDSDEQVAWEHAMRTRARKFGVTVFWLAARDLSDTTYPSGRAYAQTTRVEIGQALGWLEYDPNLPTVFGIDPDYSKNGGGSEGYIRRILEHTPGTHIVHNSVEVLEQEIAEKLARL